jgi:hypothetical protein
VNIGGGNVDVGPDDSWECNGRDPTEDVGLPDHERDEIRRSEGTTFEDDAPRSRT